MELMLWSAVDSDYLISYYFKVTGADKQADGSYKVQMENVKSGKAEVMAVPR